MRSWVEEIRYAFDSLGGAAQYEDLYRFIELTTQRNLTREWKATVRRTIEDHSSDSDNFRSHDYFKKLGHGFWGLRGVEVSDSYLEDLRRETPDEKARKVFVREHWRAYPGNRNDESEGTLSQLKFQNAWCSDKFIEVIFSNGLRISSPQTWFPVIEEATPVDKADIKISEKYLEWPRLGFKAKVMRILVNVEQEPK